MSVTEIKKGIYWVGAVDWNLRSFHGETFSTHKGTTYNSYLIVDDQVTLVDGVYTPFAEEQIKKIVEIIGGRAIDYFIVNHIEIDHSGSFPTIMNKYPQAKVYCTRNAKLGLEKYFHEQWDNEWDINIVKSGDRINLGRLSLEFLEAPMLHWPDSMFTYIKEVKLLLPNDAFGQHLASNKLFDDENDIKMLLAEAAKYYANILNPFGKLVLNKLAEIQKLGWEIDMIAPSHGIIWRQGVGEIIAAYQKWAQGEVKNKAVIAYDTMWESTAMLAHALLDGLTDEGIEARLYQVPKTDENDLITEIRDAKAVLIGSSTIHNDILPTLSPLLDELVSLKLGDRLFFAFGSQGWAGGAIKTIEKKLTEAGMKPLGESLSVKWRPTPEELDQAREMGRKIAKEILNQ